MDEHTLNDLLECSVCLERLDTSSKVLPCQHTFCRKCLEVIYASRQELRCPECRILVDTKIDDLPPNVLLMRILEGMKNAASKQHSIINEITKETNEKKETVRLLTAATTSGGGGGGVVPATAANHTAATLNTNISNEERMRQQLQQQQLKQRQQQILQFQQQIQQQHHLHATQNHQQQQQQTSHQQQLQQTQQQQQVQNQSRRCIVVPHAFALYDFESNEPNDLKFKKGDLILLKRKIDSNWYVGQLKGNEGNFPINYVQIVVPLPTSQCVALYDFKMGANEEEGCLTFKKGTIIQVLRRVDHNWAEGRIGSSIGIFPIAFVELNHLAKQLLEGFVLSTTTTSVTQQQQQPPSSLIHHNPQTNTNNDIERNLPPLPPIIDPTLNTNTSDSTTSSSTVSSTTNTASSSSNSSNTTSPTAASSVNPNNSSNSAASFHSMPNSPQSSKPSTPQHFVAGNVANSTNPTVRMRNNNDLKHKRHSLNALLNNGNTALSIMQTNRHSAEILSVPNDDFDNEVPSSSNVTTVAASGQTIAAREQQVHSSNTPSVSNQHSIQIAQNETPISTTTSSSSSSTSQQASRHNVLKTCVQQNVPPSLPWGYLALYPYKPRKADELELKKGCVYMVTERCLDGWFKGKNWKDISGVFPGNYVTPLRARDQQQLMHSWKLVPPSATMQSNYQTATTINQNSPTITTTAGQQTTTTTQQQQQQQQQLSPSYPSSMRNDLENINARLTLANLTPHQAMPPDLPPRYLAISPTPTNNLTSGNTITLTSKENRDKEAQKEKPTTTGCISTSSSSSSSSQSTSTSSSASAGLKKFLTHIKSRSKSPSAAVAAAAAAASVASIQANVITQSHSNVVPQHNLKSTNQSLTSTLTPVHVRSGSCPSQLLQNLPTDVHLNNQLDDKNLSTNNSQQSSPQNQYGSHRIKGPKERASLENTRPTIDSTLRSIYANHIQQQSALMASNKCAQQYQQQHLPPPSLPTNSNPNLSNTAIAIHHRKSHSLDASNILQSSPITPATSSFSHNGAAAGSGGGGVGVTALKTSAPQCNINAAAIHASATTKSTQNMSESRFRCVVPYPPNSDVELELQVGDIIFVYRKQKNGWYKGTNSRTYKTGLFPASFVEPDI